MIAQIAAAPDDDAPRMVYADYLTDRGDPLGDFIRVQCALAVEADPARRRQLARAEHLLLAAHGAAWLAPLYDLFADRGDGDELAFTHERGFVAGARLPLACADRLAALVDRAPLLCALALHDRTYRPAGYDWLDAAFARPAWRRIAALDVDAFGAADAVALAIARAPNLAALTTLRLRGSNVFSVRGEPRHAGPPLGEATVSSLATAPHLAGIVHLAITDDRIQNAGVRAIARGAWRLQSLDVRNQMIGRSLDLIDALSGPALAGLRALGLSASTVLPDVATPLAAGGALMPLLADLDLSMCGWQGDRVAVFCEALARPALRRLDLSNNIMANAGAHALARCPALAGLEHLALRGCRIGPAGVAALAASPYLNRVQVDLREN